MVRNLRVRIVHDLESDMVGNRTGAHGHTHGKAGPRGWEGGGVKGDGMGVGGDREGGKEASTVTGGTWA